MLTRILRPSIARHDKHHVAEIGLPAFVVRQTGIVHHLQQDVVDILMSLLNLIEEQHTIRGLTDGIRQ